MPSLAKIAPACQGSSPQLRATDSTSTNAVSFSSACTTKRFPSPRCASAIQIVRPFESIAETQPPTPIGFAEIVGDDLSILHWQKKFSGETAAVTSEILEL
jgi:hypothetical protein